MKLCTAVQEGCGYKNTLGTQRYFAPLAKYFTVCITYQPPLVHRKLLESIHLISTVDNELCIRQILEKKWKYNKAVHQLFIDFKEAYD